MTRGRRSRLGALVLALVAGPAAAFATPPPAAPQASAAVAPSSITRAPIARALPPDTVHTYRLDLRAGDYVRLVIAQDGVDVGVALLSPRRVVVAASQRRRGGELSLTAVAPLSGAYHVEVRSLERAPVSGRYRIHASDVRAASPADRQRAAAARWLAGAEARRARRSPGWLAAATIDYRRAAAASLAARDRSGQAHALRGLGEARHEAGRPEEALAPLVESLQLARRQTDGDAASAAQSALARVHLDLGRMEEAERLARQALDESRATGLRAREVDALNVLGDVSLFTGQSRRALDLLADARRLAHELGDRRGEAQAHLNQGYAAADLSDVPTAQTAWEAAIALYRAVDDPSGEASALTGQGYLLNVIGEKQRALGAFRRALTLLERVGDRIGIARVSTGLGKVQFDLGEPAVALRHYQRALDLFRAVKVRNGEAGTLLPLGLCLTALGRHRDALARYQAALTLTRAVGDTRLEGRALEHLGRGYTELGELDQAIAFYEQSRTLTRSVSDSTGEMYALNSIGTLLARKGRYADAAASLDAALDVARRSKNRFGESLVLYSQARTDRDAGEPDRALGRVRASLQLVEATRGNVASLDLRASYVASIRERQELEIDLLMQLHEREPAAGHDARAFEASERARARSFLDGLAETRAGIRDGVAPALLEQQRALAAALNVRAQRLSRLRQSGGKPADIDALSAEIEALTGEQRDLEAQMRADNPRYAALVAPAPVTLDQVRARLLDDRSVLVEFFLGAARSYVWAVTETRVESHVLPARADIERLVRPLRDTWLEPPPDTPARAPGADAAAARAVADVSRLLLAPLVASLDRPRVLVAPDGILHLVPFAALADPTAAAAAPDAPLVARHEVIHLPSASTMVLMREEERPPTRWTRTAMVFADPIFEGDDPRVTGAPPSTSTHASPALGAEPLGRALRSVGLGRGGVGGHGIPRLLEARQEARAIAALSPGVTLALDFAANRAAAMSPDLAAYRVVHFATHGVADSDHPELSGIVLSLFDERRRRQDGFLRLHDIYNLTLPADLVVLSACSTGIGREVIGEGLIGLVRGFMHAGAHRVVASLWKVDDQATSALMTRFYRGIFTDSLTPSAALRAAQLEMRRTPRWRHPFYWAAFVLHGEWN